MAECTLNYPPSFSSNEPKIWTPTPIRPPARLVDSSQEASGSSRSPTPMEDAGEYLDANGETESDTCEVDKHQAPNEDPMQYPSTPDGHFYAQTAHMAEEASQYIALMLRANAHLRQLTAFTRLCTFRDHLLPWLPGQVPDQTPQLHFERIVMDHLFGELAYANLFWAPRTMPAHVCAHLFRTVQVWKKEFLDLFPVEKHKVSEVEFNLSVYDLFTPMRATGPGVRHLN